MTLIAIKKKSFQFALLLTGCFMVGCVATQPHNASWPWNTKNDYDMKQTGDFIAASVGVAQFGDAPKAVEPIHPETFDLHRSETAPQTPAPSAISDGKFDTLSLSTATIPDLDKKPTNAGEYDFSVQVIAAAPLSYLPVETVKPEYPVTAINRGTAPVSLAFDIDSDSHQKWSADKPLPFYAVIPPHCEMIVAHLSAKTKYDSGSFRFSYSWSLGGYNASHLSPEHYQFPFPTKVNAVATMPIGDSQPSSADKNSIIFVMPVSTPILAARKGTVVRIKGKSKVEVLHDDSTIASYEHLGEIDRGISVGSVVSTEDRIGIVGALGKEKEGYLRLTVWRPEPRPAASFKAGSSSPGFDIVSLPLEFCSANFKGCRALTNDQTVSRSPIAEKKRKVKGKASGT
jgi:hypothetical protein